MTEEELRKFDFASVDVSGILPQRPPFVLVSRLVSFGFQRTRTEFDVREDNVFMEDGMLVPEGLIENVAQTCAARIGFINKYILKKPVNIGYVCAVKDFKVVRSPRLGETLATTVDLAGDFGSLLMVSASVRSGSEVLASGTMTLSLDESKEAGGRRAVVKVGDNIVSPLGTTTRENYRRVKAGESALRLHAASRELPEAYFASLIGEDSLSGEYSAFGIGGEYTRFERRIILSIAKALQGTAIDPASPRTLFIISSTKGDIDLLDSVPPAPLPLLGVSARRISEFFGNMCTPLTVSNACISGLSAQIAAMRALRSGKYDNAIVGGSDVIGRFIVSGFQSFKALSTEACRPFDADRQGLNLGEAAATIIYSGKVPEEGDWVMLEGAVRNDANHISGPSRTGEGSYRALRAVLGDTPPEDLALVSAHGTSTPYNDEMESIAISRAGLAGVPVNSLKGTFGHTMGAAGILETILSMASIDDGTVLGTRGYSKNGVSCPLDICAETRTTGKRSFIKLLSGFGGCNAAAIFRKGGGL